MFLCLPQSCNTICKLGCYKGADTNILPGVCGLIMGLFAMEYFIILLLILRAFILLLVNNPPETSFDILKSLPFLVQIKTKSETLMFRPIFYNFRGVSRIFERGGSNISWFPKKKVIRFKRGGGGPMV